MTRQQIRRWRLSILTKFTGDHDKSCRLGEHREVCSLSGSFLRDETACVAVPRRQNGWPKFLLEYYFGRSHGTPSEKISSDTTSIHHLTSLHARIGMPENTTRAPASATPAVDINILCHLISVVTVTEGFCRP